MATEGSILRWTDGFRDVVPMSLVRERERQADREAPVSRETSAHRESQAPPPSLTPTASSQRLRIQAASLDTVLASLAALSLGVRDTTAKLTPSSDLHDLLERQCERLDACTEAVVARMRLLGVSPGEACDGWHLLQEMLGDAGDPPSSHVVSHLLSGHRSALAEVCAARALMTRSWGPVDGPTRALLATIERTLQRTIEHLARLDRSERVSRIPA